uniref:septation ring formation regulator EzrA n=1 Tax=Staphylococcus epidermidis TaxID=1282 RepID=UPI0028CB9454
PLLTSNLTSLPERFVIIKNQIHNQLTQLNHQFTQPPIHLKQLNHKLPKILIQINTFQHQPNHLLLNPLYPQNLIQYPNTYPNHHHHLHKTLNQ